MSLVGLLLIILPSMQLAGSMVGGVKNLATGMQDGSLAHGLLTRLAGKRGTEFAADAT